MAFDYAAMAETATELLTEFGQTVTRRAVINGEYDPATGTAGTTTSDTSRTGVILPFQSGITHMRGNMVQMGDAQLLLDPNGSVEMTDRYILDMRGSLSWYGYFHGDVAAQEFSVVSYERLAPAGRTVLYTLHLRQS